MGYLYLLTSILVENAGKILDKFNFKHTSISPRESLLYVFSTMAVVVGVAVAVIQPEVPPLTLAAVVPLLLIVLISLLSNVLDAISLKVNDLSLREPLSGFHPILAGFIGYILFPEERNAYLLAALIAGGFVVAWGINLRTLRKAQKIGILYMLFAVILESLLSNVYAVALQETRPELIAFVRTASIALLLYFFLKPKRRVRKRRKQSLSLAVLAGLAYGVGAIVGLYAIRDLGIVTTMLLMLLGPALRYTSAFIFLKDKPTRKEIISSILLGCIAAGVAFV